LMRESGRGMIFRVTMMRRTSLWKEEKSEVRKGESPGVLNKEETIGPENKGTAPGRENGTQRKEGNKEKEMLTLVRERSLR